MSINAEYMDDYSAFRKYLHLSGPDPESDQILNIYWYQYLFDWRTRYTLEWSDYRLSEKLPDEYGQ